MNIPLKPCRGYVSLVVSSLRRVFVLLRLFLSLGLALCLVVCSSRPDPCVVCCSRPSFSVWLFGSSATFVFVSLRCWGNPNPSWFGFPLVFFHRGHDLHPRPIHLLRQHPKPTSRSFCLRRSCWIAVFWWSVFFLFSLSLSLYLFFWGGIAMGMRC